MISGEEPAGGEPLLRLEDCVPEALIAGYYHFRRPARFRYTLEGWHHLLLVDSGTLTSRHRDGRPLVAGRGDLICFRPEPDREYRTSAGVRFYQLGLRLAPTPLATVTPWIEGYGLLPELLPLGEAAGGVAESLREICLNLAQTGTRPAMLARIGVLEILAEVARLTAGSAGVSCDDPWQRARALLDQCARREVNIGALSQELNLSREHLIRGFRERFGLTPYAYHKQARLREAARLLRHTSSAIKVVAADVGYRDWRSFTRAFAQQWGMPPTEFRARPEVGTVAELALPVNTHLTPPGKDIRAALQAAVELEAMANDDRPSWQADR